MGWIVSAIFSILFLIFITIVYFIIGLTVRSVAGTKITFIFASVVLFGITCFMVLVSLDSYAGRKDAVSQAASFGAIFLVFPIAALTFGMIISRFIRNVLKKKKK